MTKRKEVDIRGDLRFIHDEPYQPTSDTLEYETEEMVKKRKVRQEKANISPEMMKPRTPQTEEEKEKAKKAEEFLKRWGV